MVDGVGVQQLVDPFIDRNACPERKQQDRDDKAPKIQLGGVAKRVSGVGRALGSLDSDQQQSLVRRVNERMDCFRQHGRRSAPPGGSEFGNGDAQIAGQRDSNDGG